MKSRSAVFAAVLATFVLLASGCVVIPTSYHSGGSRQNLSHGEEKKLTEGTTSKREVLLMLGAGVCIRRWESAAVRLAEGESDLDCGRILFCGVGSS